MNVPDYTEVWGGEKWRQELLKTNPSEEILTIMAPDLKY